MAAYSIEKRAMINDPADVFDDSPEQEGSDGDDAALVITSKVIKSASQTGYAVTDNLAELQSVFLHVAGPEVEFDLEEADQAFESGFKVLLVSTPAYVDNASMEYYMAEYPPDDGNGLNYFDMTVKLQNLQEARDADDEGLFDGPGPDYLARPMHTLLMFAVDDDFTLRELKLAYPGQEQELAVAMQPFHDALKLEPPVLSGKWRAIREEYRKQFH